MVREFKFIEVGELCHFCYKGTISATGYIGRCSNCGRSFGLYPAFSDDVDLPIIKSSDKVEAWTDEGDDE